MRACPSCGSARVGDDWTCLDCGRRPELLDGYPAFAPELAAENAGFRSAYFGELAGLEAQSWWFRARNDLIAWAIETFAPSPGRVLEIGCGTGFVLERVRSVVPDAELWGSEIFSAGLAVAGGRVPGAHFLQLDARELPFRDHFDLIGAFDVIEHIAEDEAVIAAVQRALRPGGAFVLTVPQHPSLWSPQDVHAGHVRRYSAGGLRRKLEAGGFEVVRAASFVSLLLPLMFLSRLTMRRASSNPDFDAVDTLRQPRIVNRVLESVMMVERGLIRRGLALPAGGSLLVIARSTVPPPTGTAP